MRDFKKYDVWTKSHHLTLQVYQETKSWPKEEAYGLTSQIRRAMSSVSTDITEGAGRNSDKEFAQFLNIALGSTSEVSYLILLAKDLKYFSIDISKDLNHKILEISKMLRSLQEKVRKS